MLPEPFDLFLFLCQNLFCVISVGDGFFDIRAKKSLSSVGVLQCTQSRERAAILQVGTPAGLGFLGCLYIPVLFCNLFSFQ